MPDWHFYLLRHHILPYIQLLFFCFLALDEIRMRIPLSPTMDLDWTEKRNNTISQMRIGSVFKMRMSILNTATTEQMGYGIISFFVYTKSTNQELMPLSFITVDFTESCGKRRFFPTGIKMRHIPYF